MLPTATRRQAANPHYAARLHRLRHAQDARRFRVLDLFSGIGGFSLGLERAGMQTVAFCEIDPFCQSVLARHWPRTRRYDDIHQLTSRRLHHDHVPTIDLICGGYPCQPFSIAGKQRGERDPRHLWPEMHRLIREVRPRWVVCENVAGHVEHGLDTVLADLEALGYTATPFVLPACAVGAPHRRDRVWIVAHARGLRLLDAPAPRVAPHLPDRTSWWDVSAPFTTGSDDGIPARLDRTRALGNAVVPQIAEAIGLAIMACDRGGETPPPRTDTRTITLPQAPRNASPVPHLTSLYHFDDRGPYGSRRYPGNCGGGIIRDLLCFFQPRSVFDPMTGSGTCADVCRELAIPCTSSDLHAGVDACDPAARPASDFEFCWLHPPYWRQKLYTADARDLSRETTMDGFLKRYEQLLANCGASLAPGGRLAVLMGEYIDRRTGFVPLVYHTKHIAFSLGLQQCSPDIIRFLHGASSNRKTYGTSFIPTLHDVCMVFQKPAASGQDHVSIDRIGKMMHHTLATHGQGGHP